MSHLSRSMSVVSAAAAAGAIGLGGLAGTASATPAPAAPTATTPHVTVELWPGIEGRTLKYRYSERGVQHLVTDSTSKKPHNNGESVGYRIYLDGKEIEGGDGLGDATCTTHGLAPFSGRGEPRSVRLTKPGRHVLKVATMYCGDKGVTTATRTYTLRSTAPVKKSTASLTAAGTFTPGKALKLTGTCSAASVKTATVVGPRNMKATLKRTSTGKTLTGSIAVPAKLQGSWIRLRITCSDGATATKIVTRTGAKATPPAS